MIAEEVELAVLKIRLFGHFHLSLTRPLKGKCIFDFACFGIERVYFPDSIHIIKDAIMDGGGVSEIIGNTDDIIFDILITEKGKRFDFLRFLMNAIHIACQFFRVGHHRDNSSRLL